MLGASLTAILLSYEDLDRGDVPHLPGLRALYLLCADVDVLHKEGPVAQSPRDYFCHVDRPADRHAPCLYVDLSHLRELDERRHRVAHHCLFPYVDVVRRPPLGHGWSFHGWSFRALLFSGPGLSLRADFG